MPFPTRISGSRNRIPVSKFHWKLISSRFCACAVVVWLKFALNAAKSPKCEEVVVADDGCGSRFTVSFKADVIVRTHSMWS